ncbi:hypothetical protein HYH02_012377 [Chlamydomonas schloesseri]|uniref:Uncharacterized protein n=1 Tax=Chlamydomonas schloesseri TaxID=2026947 RepID=A0A835SW15_9CHLO|nr:hypothetical protein HYH02_012377 [Chlamydomonas schloesseri]|eukprot:KAG2434362.1 hypothetical protein HYH02_012377 [Chlamydomonas schloesseri]
MPISKVAATGPEKAQQPWPGDAFVRHWGRAEPWRALNLRERRRLLCLAAGSGHAASLAAVLAHCGCALDVHALEAAAAAGDVSACETLLSAGCEWGQSVFAAAAAAGQLPVCQAFWAAGLRPLPIRNCRCSVVEAACRGGHTHVLEWLEQVGFVRLLAPPPPALPSISSASAAAGKVAPAAADTSGSSSRASGNCSASSSSAATSSAHSTKGSSSKATSPPPAATAPDAMYYLHAFAAIAAAAHGHTALLRRLLDFGRSRYAYDQAGIGYGGAHDDDDNSVGSSASSRLPVDGVARPHRLGLALAVAGGCSVEQFAAVFDDFMAREWGHDANGGGMSLGELHAAMLRRAAGSPLPDGTWRDKVDFLLTRVRERLGQGEAGAAAGGLAAAGAGWARDPEVGVEGPWSVWEGAAHHSDPAEVERRVRFLVSRGLQPDPGALRAVAAAGSVGAARLLLEQCGVQLTPAVAGEAARFGRLGVVAWLCAEHRVPIDERLVLSALTGVWRVNFSAAAGLSYGSLHSRSGPPQNGTAGGAMQLLRWVVRGLAEVTAGGGNAGRGGTGSGLVNPLSKHSLDGANERGGLGGADGGLGAGGASPTPDGPPASRQHAGLWLHVLEEACASGVSHIDLLEQLLERTGLLAPRPVAAAAAGAAVADEDEEEDTVDRAAIATRLANGLLAGGSEAAVHWAARRLRELCRGAAVPALTPVQLWKAALGGNLAAVRAACATGLAHMPDWLPECACEAGQPAGGHVAGAMRFFLEQPTCRGAKNWRRLWRRLRAEQAERFWVVHLTPAQMEWLRRRQKQQAEKRRQAASQVADRVLCGLGGMLRRMCGWRGAGGGGDNEEEAVEVEVKNAPDPQKLQEKEL